MQEGAVEDRPDFRSPPALQDLAIVLFVILAGLMIVGAIVSWLLHIPPFG